ncbi:CARDB domain-containing protein [bacterium]
MKKSTLFWMSMTALVMLNLSLLAQTNPPLAKITVDENGNVQVHDTIDSQPVPSDAGNPDLSKVMNPGPDLIIEDIEIEYFYPILRVTAVIRNVHTASDSAGPSYLGYYLSEDNHITTSDQLILSKWVPALAVGASTSQGSADDVSSFPGTWWVGCIADFTNIVVEEIETNNTFTKGDPIEIPKLPNLTALMQNSSYNYTYPNLTINVQVINIGGMPAGSFSVAYYLSRNDVISGNDTHLGYYNVKELVVGAYTNATIIVDVSAYPGTWYVGFYIDYNDKVHEAYGNDNDFTFTPPITVQPPFQSNQADLIVTEIQVIDGDGPDISYKLSVKNRGAAETTSKFKNRIYLSSDNISTSEDYLINDWNVTNNLAPNESKTSWDLTSNVSGLPPGEYYLGVIVDAKDAIVESNENNNTGFADTPNVIISEKSTGLWEVQQSGTGNRLYYVAAVSSLEAWAVGFNGIILRTIDGGDSWTDVWHNNESTHFFGVDALDANTAFVTGYTGDYIEGTNVSVIYKTTDGGSSWTKVHEHANAWMNHVKMLDVVNGMAIGDPFQGIWKIVHTTDEGNSWQQIPNTPAAELEAWSSGYSVFWLNRFKGWFGTSTSNYYQTVDGGNSWSQASIPELPLIHALSFNSTGIGMAGNREGQFVRTMDEGINWESISLPNDGVLRYLLYNQNNFWLLLDNFIYNSNDQGSTWSVQQIAEHTLRHLAFTSDQQGTSGWAVGDEGVILKYYNPESVENMLVNGDFSNNDTGWILSTVSPAQTSVSVQNGEYVVATEAGGNSVWDINVKQPGVLMETGRTYTVIFDAYADAPRQVIPFTGMNEDPWTVYGTQNFDVTTSKENYSFSFTMNHPTDADARFAFDLGWFTEDAYLDNVVLYGTGEATGIERKDNVSQSDPTSFNLHQNFPNPFNPSTTIRYTVPKICSVTLTIYDLLGREILTLVNETRTPGEYSTIWDGQGQATGIYLVRLTAGDFIETKKLILQK